MTVADTEKQRPFWTPKKVFVAALAVVILSWGSVFIIGMAYWGENTDTRGQFGDAFGLLGALFAGLGLVAAGTAAYFQWIAMQEERAASAADAVESRFFQLVASLQSAVNATRNGEYQGRQAIRKISEWLTVNYIKDRKLLNAGPDLPLAQRQADIERWFSNFYAGQHTEDGKETRARAGDLLGYIFRLVYHIVKYVGGSNAITADDKLFYIRILRAHLSNPELVLLLYNALSHHGYPNMFNLIEQHDLLQNIDLRSLPDIDDALLYKTLQEKVKLCKKEHLAGAATSA